MPSSHTALVVGLTTAIGLKDALDSSIFALCLVFSLVVRYDLDRSSMDLGMKFVLLRAVIVESSLGLDDDDDDRRGLLSR